jgi:hypothetical protein
MNSEAQSVKARLPNVSNQSNKQTNKRTNKQANGSNRKFKREQIKKVLFFYSPVITGI